MSRQYKRAYSLAISDGANARVIDKLRVSFQITKSLMSFPNLAQIDVYNPSKDTLSMLETKFNTIQLNAGYEGNVRMLFTGQIRNVFQRKQGPDRIVTVFAGDGEQDWQNSIFNKTFSENVTIKRIVQEIAQSFENTITGALQGLDSPADKLRGQSLSGSSKDVLDKLARDYGFAWSIQDGQLVTVPNEDVLDDRDAVLINQATGMIGSPTITELGVNVTTLLNPELLPNRAFKVEATAADVAIGGVQFRTLPRTSGTGFYKTYQVIFNGDTHANNWFSTVEGRIVNNAIQQ